MKDKWCLMGSTIYVIVLGMVIVIMSISVTHFANVFENLKLGLMELWENVLH